MQKSGCPGVCSVVLLLAAAMTSAQAPDAQQGQAAPAVPPAPPASSSPRPPVPPTTQPAAPGPPAPAGATTPAPARPSPGTLVAPGSPGAAPPAAPVVVLPPLNYPGPLPSFEVASVKKASSPNTSFRLTLGQGGRANISLTLRDVIQLVWNAKTYQIVGGPSWLASDRFIINAKAETDVPRDQVYLMMRALIIERFKLKFHIESRQMNTYVLLRPGPDSPLGAGLKPVDCSGPRPPTSAAVLEAALRGGSTAPLPCGLTMSSTNGIRAGGITMASLASLLGSVMSTTVVDRTNMTGTYSLVADFAMSSRSSLSAAAPGESLPPMTDISSGGSVFSAVRDLGLRLERKREGVDVLVIDSVEQPDED